MDSDTEALARSIQLTEEYNPHSETDDASTVRGSISDFSRTATCYPIFFASGRTEATVERTNCEPRTVRRSCFKRQRQGYFLISFISLIVLAGLAMIFVGYYLHNRGYLLVVGIIYPWVVGVPTCYVYCQYRGSRPRSRRRGSTIALSSAMSIEVPPPEYECRHQFTSVSVDYSPQTGWSNQCSQSNHGNGTTPGPRSPRPNRVGNGTSSGTNRGYSLSMSCDEPPPAYDDVAAAEVAGSGPT
ncbi:uncharacterized protein LOC129269971 [Lytechinus pictus]|uniref:uncharacterized protein LOC129269971 n=1 Tax=Lytechinus pictus TaxID=7653 RepID=UPI0030B9F465